MWLLADFQGMSDKMVFWFMGGAVAIIAIVSAAMTRIFTTRARENTRREIAAYLAEGSIDKETALALMKREGEDEDGEESES